MVVDRTAARCRVAGEPYGGRTMPTGAGRPYNLVSVVPHPSELYSVIVDLLGAVQWTRLAVVYQQQTHGNDTRCHFNVRTKADTSRLNLPHGNDN